MLRNIIIQTAFLFLSYSLAEACMYTEVGASVLLPLGFNALDDSSHLTWKHNQYRVYARRGNKVKEDKLKVKPNGSLILENIQLSNAGEYHATVYNLGGVHQHSATVQLCVLEPLSEPLLTATCDKAAVTLVCDVESETESVSWRRNGNPWNTTMTNKTLTLDSSLIGVGDNVSCTAKNKISMKTSKEVRVLCHDAGPHPRPSGDQEMNQRNKSSNEGGENDGQKRVFGMDERTVITVTAGAGVLLLVLLGSCCIHFCKKKQERVEEEHRLATEMQSDCPQGQKKPE